MSVQEPTNDENLERRMISKDNKNIAFLLVGLLGLGGIACSLANRIIYQKTEVRENLAPHAIHIEQDAFGFGPSSVSTANLDVNGDGKYESVMDFKNPQTGNPERRLIEIYGDQVRIRPYKVVDGQIRYLD